MKSLLRHVSKNFIVCYLFSQALYENMLVELPFASFFLCKLLSKHGTDVDIHHLESLDPEMYRYDVYTQATQLGTVNVTKATILIIALCQHFVFLSTSLSPLLTQY